MICGNGLWDIVANLCFSYTRVTIFLLGRFGPTSKERSKKKLLICWELLAGVWCILVISTRQIGRTKTPKCVCRSSGNEKTQGCVQQHSMFGSIPWAFYMAWREKSKPASDPGGSDQRPGKG